MSKRPKQAEEVADRILAGLRPGLIRLVERELAQVTQASTVPVELSERDVAEAEALVGRWGVRNGSRRG